MRNRPHRLVAAVCGSLLLTLPATAVAQQDSAAAPSAAKPADTRPLPTAKALHAKMIDFMGGREAFAEIGPVRSVGTFEIPSMQMKGGMRTFSAPPDMMRVEVDMPGVGSSFTVFDGKVGWSLDPMRGASLMDGEMLEQIRMEADPKSELELLERYDVAKVTGRENFEGVECVVLHLEKGKLVEDRFIVESTGEFKGRRAKAPSPMGEIPTVTVNQGWKMIGKRKVPARTVIRMMGMEQIMTIDEIIEGDLAPDTFAQPPAIKALVTERDAAKKSVSKTVTDSDSASDSKRSSSSSSDSSSSSSKDSSSSSSSDSSSQSSKDSSRNSSRDSSSNKSGSSNSNKSGSSSSNKSGSSSSSGSRGGGL